MMQRNIPLLLMCLMMSHFIVRAQRSTIKMHLPQIDLGCIDDLKALPKPDPDGVKAETSCHQVPIRIKHIDDFIVNQICAGQLLRVYEATDECGTIVRDTQVYLFVLDTLRPIEKIEIDLGCNPDLKRVIPDPHKPDLDPCYTDYKWLGDEQQDRDCRKTLIRKYEIFTCHTSFQLVFCFNWIEDMVPPTITCPSDIHFGCDFTGLPPADVGEVGAEDNCCLDSVWWGGDIVVSNFDTCEHSIVRRYWAVDCCGNLSYCDQVFSWYSFPEDPVITACPPGAYLGCNIDLATDIPAATPDLVEVLETCGEYEVTSQLSDITIFGCEYAITRIYTVQDECGNSSQCFQNFTWTVDEEAPNITTCPSDLDLGCNPQDLTFDLVAPDFGIVASDNCGIASIERVRTTDVERKGCERFYYIHYEISDSCGNTETCKQRVHWREDTIPPHIICPPDIDLGCNPAAIPAPDPTLVKASDDCCLENVIWLVDIIVENPNDCQQERIRKYQAQDCCGNISVCEQRITWTSDVQPPIIIDCPNGWDLGCNIDLESDLPPATPELVIAEDDCSDVEISTHLSDITIFGCEYSISRIYVVSDQCGNENICLQTFTWTVDTEAPMVKKCPSDVDLGCNPDTKDFDLVSPDFGIEAEDNCGIASIKRVATSEVKEGDRCQKYYLITYEIKDHCGNAAECTQKIFWIDDKKPPSIICPPDLDLGCDPQGVPEPNPEQVKAKDNCCLKDVQMTASSIFTENGFYKITRTYTATDCCGNQSSCDQVIVWRQQPMVTSYIACPEDVDFGCVKEDPVIPDPIEDTPYGGEECPSLFTHAGDNLVQVTPCEYELTRTYLFISCCGDTVPCFQTFEWQWVNTDSVIPVPPDQVSICVVPPLPDFVGVLCGPGVPIFAGQNIIGDCSDGNCTVQRIWHSKGCLGSLFISDVQTIDVVCQIAPVDVLDDKRDPKIKDLIMYPNPASDVLNLDFKGDIYVREIIIYDIQGRAVRQIPINQDQMSEHQLSISDLDPGMYQIQVEGTGRWMERFVKI